MGIWNKLFSFFTELLKQVRNWTYKSLVSEEINKTELLSSKNVKQDDLVPPLPSAAPSGRLLKKRVDINCSDNFGLTSLMEAAKCNNIPVLKILLQKGAKVNLLSKSSNSALCYATENQNVQAMKLLLEYGSLVKDKHLMTVAKNNNTVIFKYLLDNCKTEIDKNTSLLMDCSREFHISFLEMLLSYGWSPNYCDLEGLTPLMVAKDDHVMKLLLSHGADVNVQDRKGQTALVHMLTTCRYDSARLLLESEADVNLATERGWTPLMIEAQKSGRTFLGYLLRLGSDVNKVDLYGQSALFHAVCVRNIGNIDLLIINDAEVNVQNRWMGKTNRETLHQVYGLTCLMKACHEGDRRVVHRLLDAGADVNLETDNGDTALHFASNSYIVQLLIEKGADVNKQNDMGLTPLVFRALIGNRDCLKPLLKNGARADIVGKTAGYTCLNAYHSMPLKDFNDEDCACLELVLQAGGARAASLCCDTLLLKMIIKNKRSLVRLCVTEGCVPTNVCTMCLRYCFSPYLLRKLQGNPVSPLCAALICGNVDIAEYLVNNWYMTGLDLQQGYLTQVTEGMRHIPLDCREFLYNFLRTPISLAQRSFITISDSLGHYPGRLERLKNSGLPVMHQNKLSFKYESAELKENNKDNDRLNVLAEFISADKNCPTMLTLSMNDL